MSRGFMKIFSAGYPTVLAHATPSLLWSAEWWFAVAVAYSIMPSSEPIQAETGTYYPACCF